METTTINFSWLCIVIPIGIMIIVAFLGTRSKLHYARRIIDGQANDPFKVLKSPEAKSRIKRLAILTIIGVLGTIISLAILVIQRMNKIPVPFETILAAFIVFGILAVITGFLIQREIVHRL